MKRTLKLALLAMLLPMAAMAQTAPVQTAPYIITGSSGSFSASKGGVRVGTGAIQAVIDSIKTDANFAASEIQFGRTSTDTLNIGNGTISFGTGWGKITLSGNITNIGSSSPIFSEDFEGATNAFTFVNGTQVNQWHIGTVITGSSPNIDTTKAAFISKDGGDTNSYTLSAPSIVHIYTDITFPASANAFPLTFKHKGNREAGYDYLTVHLVDTSVVPTAGSVLAGDSLYTTPGNYTSWQNATVNIPAVNSMTTKRLVFTWRNNNVGGTNPPIAIDSIVVKTTTAAVSPGSYVIRLNESANVESKANIIVNNNYAIQHSGYGQLTISGGTVSATTGTAIYNNGAGVVSISGGTVSATTGYAIANDATGAVSISGGTITSANPNTTTQGTIYTIGTHTGGSARLEIIGGTIENTLETSVGNAVYIGNSSGLVLFGGNPSITGYIRTGTAGLSVVNGFAPTVGKIYTLSLPSYTPSYLTPVVLNGRDFIDNFELSNITYMLDTLELESSNNGLFVASAGFGYVGPEEPEEPEEGEDPEEVEQIYVISRVANGTSIQSVIDAIRVEAAGEDCEIHFGNGTDTLRISSGIAFSGAWGDITLLGKIVSTSTANSEVITINGPDVDSKLDIIKNNTSSYVIRNSGAGDLTISGGTISTKGSYAVYNAGAGNITISDGAIISVDVNYAVYNSGVGTITISDGDISAVNYAINNNAAGTITISGGTVSATTGYAVYNNNSGGKIVVSDSASITSANPSATQGTIYLVYGSLEITGGTIENTYVPTTGTTIGNAIYNSNTVTILLGGNPAITGNIRTLIGNLTVIIDSEDPDEVIENIFAPAAGKIYTLNFGTYTASYVGVRDGASFIENFGLVNEDYDLMADTNTTNPTKNLVIRVKKGFFTYELVGDVYKVTEQDYTGYTFQGVMDSIKVKVAGAPAEILFGSGTDTLNAGVGSYSFSNTGTNAWSEVTLNGKIKGTASPVITATGANVISNLDITTTGAAIRNNGSGVLSINSGTILASTNAVYNNNDTGVVNIASGVSISVTGNYAVYNAGAGEININNETISAGTYAVYNAGAGVVNINSGTILAKVQQPVVNAGTGVVNIAGGVSVLSIGYYAVNNSSTGVVNISGGTFFATGNTIYNSGAGTINIIDGAISATTDYAVYNYSTGRINISGGTISSIGSYSVSNNSSGTVEIAGGTISTTTSYAVYNSTGTLNIGGGTISATTGSAVYNGGSGALNIGGGTISATTGYAVNGYGAGKVAISGTANITSANTAYGTVYISYTASALEISGATITNTATGGNAVYKGVAGEVEIIDGAISATTGYAVYNANGPLTISGGTISTTTGVAVYNYGTGKITVSETANITSANTTIGTIYNNNASTALDILGGTIVNTSALGRAVRNSGSILLGGSPSITGIIWSNAVGNITANKDTTFGPIFAPAAGKVYTLDFNTYALDNIVVKDGKDFASNFAIAGPYGLVAKINDLVLVPMGFVYAKTEGTETLTHAGVYTITEYTNGYSIAAVLDSIKVKAKGLPVEIKLGNGTDTLKIGASSVNLNGTCIILPSPAPCANWGRITLSGKVTNTGTNAAIILSNNINAESKADIIKADTYAIRNDGTGVLTISGGTILATGYNVYNYTSGKIAISGGTIEATSATGYAVYNNGSGNAAIIDISGGTISVTANSAVHNYSTGRININGGTISATTGYAVYNTNTGSIIIDKGTMLATTGHAVYNNSNGRIEINGGTTQATGYLGYAVRNVGSGTIAINGGTISAKDTINYAVYNASGTTEISGGTVSATDTASYAVYNASGTMRISKIASITSGNTSIASGTVYLAGGTATIAGGTIRNTAEGGNAVYAATSGTTTLGGNPNITGIIRKGTGNLTTNASFAPSSGKVYTLDLASYPGAGDSAIVVTDGRNHISSFALVHTGYGLFRSGNIADKRLYVASSPEACELDGGTYNELTGTCTTRDEACVLDGNVLGADGVCRTVPEAERRDCLAEGKIYGEDGVCRTATQAAKAVCDADPTKTWQGGTGKCVSPIRLPQIASSQISVKALNKAIMLENLPKNAKVEIYNLNGERMYFANSENSQILKIQVQTKGMYVVKINRETFRIAVK